MLWLNNWIRGISYSAISKAFHRSRKTPITWCCYLGPLIHCQWLKSGPSQMRNMLENQLMIRNYIVTLKALALASVHKSFTGFGKSPRHAMGLPLLRRKDVPASEVKLTLIYTAQTQIYAQKSS